MLDPAHSQTGFLQNDGECAKLIAAKDWSDTLGPIEDWPHSLKIATGILLHSPVAMVMLWGEDGIMIYNDAYSVFAGGRHPEQLGMKVREGWPEVADFNDHVMKVGLSGGTLSYKDQELTLYRHGRPEQVWMNLDYSPVLDESGRPGGVLAIVMETTQRVVTERRAASERDRQLRSLQQMPGFSAVLSGPEHRFDYVNEAYVELAGDRDFLGRTVREVFPELADQGFYQLLDRVYSTGEAFAARSMPIALAREGGKRFIDFLYEPVRGDDGEVIGIFVGGYDVTERVEAEDQLRESEERLRLVVDGATDYAIFTIDPDRRITSWSQGAANIFGWSADEALGRVSDILWTDEDRAQLQPQKEVATAREEGCAPDERWHQRPDGTRVFLNGSVHPLPPDEHGRERGFIKVARDETERRRTEAKLRETAERYRLAARATNDAIWDWDFASGHVTWNEAVRTRFGHADAVNGTDGAWWLDHIHPEDRDRVHDSIFAVIEGAASNWSGEYRFLRADGSVAHVLDRGAVIRDDGGRAVRMIGAMLDLSERHKAEAALAETEARLRSVLEQMPIGVLLAKVPTGEVFFYNRASESILGGRIMPDRTEGYVSYGGLNEDGSPLAAEDYPLARSVRTGETVTEYPLRYRRPDGEIVHLEINAGRVLKSDGTADIAIAAFTDVTARMRGERHQRLLIDELSHRAKNLLAIIQSVAQQSFKGGASPQEMLAAFEGRLGALAAAHGILTQQKWESAPLKQIVCDTILAVRPDDQRLKVEGPELTVSPKTGVSLAMAVHELTTNALKYGSLSSDSGSVNVRWSAQDGRLLFQWVERGGPSVSPPARRGFGSRMIERGLAAELGGTVRIDFQPEGVVCTVDAPLPEAG